MLLRRELTIWTMIVWTTFCGGFAAASKAADNADTESAQSIEVDSGIAAGIPFSPIQLDGYLNVLFAPGGDLDKSGLRLQVGGQGGTFIQGPTEAQANFLLGYSFASGDNSLTLMSGVGVQSTHFTGHRVRNVNLEWASSAELDTKPTQSTTLSAQASYSTALNEYYSQLDAGYAVAKDLYLGPFVAFVGDDRFQQGRVGAKFFGIKFGSAELGLNAGYLEDLGKPSDRDHDSVVNGAFVGADVSVRY